MRIAAPLPLAILLGACSYSLEDESRKLHAQIVDLERQIPPEAPLWIFDGPDRFDAFIEDETPRVPTFIYVHLLKRLSQMNIAEVEGLSQGDFDTSDGRKDPGASRGKIWRIHGVIGELHTEPVEDTLSPVPMVHAGILFDDQMRPAIFHVVQKPDVLRHREDLVETQAVFVKMIEYTSKSGHRVVAPFFVGKVLRRYL